MKTKLLKSNVLLSVLLLSVGNSFSQLEVSIDQTPILCNGDLSDVTIAVSGGVAPYSGIGTVQNSGEKLIISGVYDGPLSGGVPKGVELYVLDDIADLSQYGLGSANNGGGTNGQEFTFPAVSASAGDYIYICSSGSTGVNGFNNFFGFAADYSTSAMSINGDDAIELFYNGAVIDVYGDINVSGTGQAWDYMDGWAYRNSGVQPNNGTFVAGEWTYSGTNALDNQSSNATASIPVPIGTYQMGQTGVLQLSAGTQVITISDANGISETVTIQIDEPTELVASATFGSLSCYGDLTTVEVSATGGTAPYTGAIGTPSSALMISAVYDGPLSGGVPKGIELYVLADIVDLSEYGIGSANNGGGTDGQEFTFPAVSASAGDYIYICSSGSTGVNGFNNFFGFAADYSTSAMSINGDDAIELFHNGSVIDVYGDINVSGAGQAWDYMDGWAYRISGSSSNGGTFDASQWLYSGTNALDGESSNSTASSPIPIGTFAASASTEGVYNGVGAGTYTYTVTDANGCSSDVTVVITEPAELTVDAGNDVTTYWGYGPSECATLEANGNGGTGTLSYTWSEGSNGSSITACESLGTTYSVTVTDDNGCTATDAIDVCVVDAVCTAGNSNNNKVEICHNGETLCVNANAVAAHLAHGDELGACNEEADCPSSNQPKSDWDLSFSETTVVVYPNPNTGTFKIDFDLDKPVGIVITNLSGKIVHETVISSGSLLMLEQLEKGTYLIQFTDPSMQTIRFVKM